MLAPRPVLVTLATHGVRVALVALVALLVAAPSPAAAQAVRQVFDGDTISVSGVGVVRLIGVDAPEKHGSYRASEPFGDAATAFLRALLTGNASALAPSCETTFTAS